VQAAFRTLREQAKTIAQISVESRLPIVPDEYVNSFKPELSEAVFKWCNGASFAELCKMCDVFEGPFPLRLSSTSSRNSNAHSSHRRIPHPMFPPIGRIAASDGSGGTSDRKRQSGKDV